MYDETIEKTLDGTKDTKALFGDEISHIRGHVFTRDFEPKFVNILRENHRDCSAGRGSRRNEGWLVKSKKISIPFFQDPGYSAK